MAFLDGNDELRGSLSAIAHLVHGSSENRFKITYATDPNQGGLTKEEVEGVGYAWRDYREAIREFDPQTMTAGVNRVQKKREEGSEGGKEEEDEVYFVQAPALGLWAAKTRFQRELGQEGRNEGGAEGGAEGATRKAGEGPSGAVSPMREPPSKRSKGLDDAGKEEG